MITIDPTTPQLKVLKELADAIASGDVKKAEPLLAKDFTFKTFPKHAELPDLTKEDYLPKYQVVFGIFANIEITFHDVIDAPGKLVTHHSFLFTTKDGVGIDYEATAVFTFVEEDGEVKILDCKEFANPEHRDALYAEPVKALGKFAT